MAEEKELYIKYEIDYRSHETNEEKVSDMLEVLLYDYGMI